MFSSPAHIVRQCGISKGAVVGDFGTGAGSYAHEAAKEVGEHGVVYAFDVQKALVEKLAAEAKRVHNSPIRAMWIDLEHPKRTGLASGTLDLAIVANVLFQIEDKARFVKEIARVLRPGGRVLVIDWKESYGHTGPHPGHVVPSRDAQRLLLAEGLEFDKNVDAGAHHYGFVFRKQTTDNGQQKR